MYVTKLILALVALIIGTWLTPLSAQENSQIQQLMPHISHALSHVEQPHVVLIMPSPCVRLLQSCGEMDEAVRAALLEADRGIRFIPEDALVTALTSEGFLPVDRYLIAAVSHVTKNLNANILIEYRITGENHISVLIFDAEGQNKFEEFGAKLTDDPSRFSPIWIDPDSRIAIIADGIVDYGKLYKMPSCTTCVMPPYSAEARSKGIEGAVSLLLTVTANGRTADIHLLKGLGNGLDQQAINAVKSWRFTPAKDPNGQKFAIRTPVEMTFRLLH